MNKEIGDNLIQRSIYSTSEDKNAQYNVGYFDDYERMMAVVDRIEDDGFWFNIMKPLVSVGKLGDAKALFAIHCNITRSKRELIWLAILRIITKDENVVNNFGTSFVLSSESISIYQ